MLGHKRIVKGIIKSLEKYRQYPSLDKVAHCVSAWFCFRVLPLSIQLSLSLAAVNYSASLDSDVTRSFSPFSHPEADTLQIPCLLRLFTASLLNFCAQHATFDAGGKPRAETHAETWRTLQEPVILILSQSKCKTVWSVSLRDASVFYSEACAFN